MFHRSMLGISLLALLLCFALTGCGGAKPLVFRTKARDVGPWCGPNQRTRIGERVVGRVHDGNKWKEFLVDNAGKEYDPEKLADQVWRYLERTGDAQKITEAYSKDAYYSSMTIVSINPLIVILETHQDTALRKHLGPSPKRYYWVAQIYAMRDPPYKEGLQWFSPDLKQRPTVLPFSQAGVAEIAIADGRLKLIREADLCKTTRE